MSRSTFQSTDESDRAPNFWQQFSVMEDHLADETNRNIFIDDMQRRCDQVIFGRRSHRCRCSAWREEGGEPSSLTSRFAFGGACTVRFVVQDTNVQ